MQEKISFSITADGILVELKPSVIKYPLIKINELREIFIQGNPIGIVDEKGEVIFKASLAR